MNKTKSPRLSVTRQAAFFQLEIKLSGIEPSIWRRLEVRGDIGLDLLHAVIQVAMGWTNSHLHAFLAGRERFVDPVINGAPEFLDEPPEVDERGVKVQEVLPRAETRLIYEYDFGDTWIHTITVENSMYKAASSLPMARCLEGARACPPEDSGGPGGYARLLEVLEDTSHEEYRDTMLWLGRRWDPDAFDLRKINRALQELRWPRTTEPHLRKVLMTRDGRGRKTA